MQRRIAQKRFLLRKTSKFTLDLREETLDSSSTNNRDHEQRENKTRRPVLLTPQWRPEETREFQGTGTVSKATEPLKRESYFTRRLPSPSSFEPDMSIVKLSNKLAEIRKVRSEGSLNSGRQGHNARNRVRFNVVNESSDRVRTGLPPRSPMAAEVFARRLRESEDVRWQSRQGRMVPNVDMKNC